MTPKMVLFIETQLQEHFLGKNTENRENPFFNLKICFFKLNNMFFESDRLAALQFTLYW